MKQQKTKLHITSSRLMNSLFVGNFKAAFSGKGIEFQDFREYSYGDDARYIDWSASSREQSTIMRRYREEKQGNILCVLDIRESLNYQQGIKKEIYREVLELLYHASVGSGESFGGYICDSNTPSYIPPQKSPIGLHTLQKLSQNYRGNSEILNIDFLSSKLMKRSVVFIFSDSLSIDEASLKRAEMRHDIIFVHVSSRFENTLEGSGVSRLTGIQEGFSIDLDDEQKRNSYQLKRKEQLEVFSRKLKSFGIDSIFLDEEKSLFAAFLGLMKQRERV